MQPIDFSQIKRVLVIKLRHHGDVLLSSPVIACLKQAHPHLEVDALVYQDTAPMLQLHPQLSQLHCIDRQWKKSGLKHQLQQEWRLLQRLKDRGYDLLIHLTESRRGAWLSRLLKPRYAVTRRYHHRQDRFWKNSFSHHYQSPGGNRRHTVEMHLDALRCLGLQPSLAQRRLVLQAGEEAQASLKRKLEQAGLSQPYLHLHPCSRWLFKCWDEAKVATLLQRLHQQGWPLVISAAPDAQELAMIERIEAQAQIPLINLAGQLSLLELAALIEQARLFIGVDSVPMHMAAALGTPTVSLFGPSGDKEWGPWMVPHRLITSSAHPCRPCGQDGCGNSKVSDCLQQLEVDQVEAAIQQLLQEQPA
ncbi:putative lipopolysaccharide heptosyltransferase III [Balneatrix alpica]|uniref:Lipopolysaccharide heptosyltransferase III n=1 Tax=Balneatrix alpica TaxID=75684 RepID=A0ABV5ZB55_9GAMM|nr:putative lipopolysaccharide heptosyltransferase III [Balneatrix alpica]